MYALYARHYRHRYADESDKVRSKLQALADRARYSSPPERRALRKPVMRTVTHLWPWYSAVVDRLRGIADTAYGTLYRSWPTAARENVSEREWFALADALGSAHEYFVLFSAGPLLAEVTDEDYAAHLNQGRLQQLRDRLHLRIRNPKQYQAFRERIMAAPFPDGYEIPFSDQDFARLCAMAGVPVDRPNERGPDLTGWSMHSEIRAAQPLSVAA
jgi:hypothetical protein